MVCWAAPITIYLDINIDKEVLCSWALLPPPVSSSSVFSALVAISSLSLCTQSL